MPRVSGRTAEGVGSGTGGWEVRTKPLLRSTPTPTRSVSETKPLLWGRWGVHSPGTPDPPPPRSPEEDGRPPTLRKTRRDQGKRSVTVLNTVKTPRDVRVVSCVYVVPTPRRGPPTGTLTHRNGWVGTSGHR